MTFSLYGPADAPVCEGESISTSTVDLTVVGTTGTATSSSKSLTAVGTYYWFAVYNGDANNKTAVHECGIPSETVRVTQAEPGIAKVVTLNDEAITGAVVVGDVLHYTVTVSNTGSATAGPETVTDVVPVGLDIDESSLTDGGTYDSVTRTITWPAISVEAGAEDLLLGYDATVNADAAKVGNDVLINDASWFGIHKDTTTYVKWIGMTAGAACDVEETHAVKVSYTVTSHNFNVLGSAATQTVDFLWNDGAVAPGTVGGVPQSLSTMGLTDTTPVSGALLYPGTAVDSGGNATGWPGWSFDGTKWTYSAAGLVSPVTLSASSFGTGASASVTYDQKPECNPPGVPLLDKASPNEYIAEVQSGNVSRGDTITYTITITNNGGQDVTGPLTDTLPGDVNTPRDFAVDTAGFTAAPAIDGRDLDWGDVTLTAGQVVTYTFKVTVDLDAELGSLYNDAQWGQLTDRTEHVVRAVVPGIAKIVRDQEGLTLTGAVEVGDNLHYVVTVTNDGNTLAKDDIEDVLPIGLAAPTDISDGGVYTAAPDGSAYSGTIMWADFEVDGDSTRSVSYNAVVTAEAATPENDLLVNYASWYKLQASTETPVKWITVVAEPICRVDTPVVTYTVTTHNLGEGPDGGWTADLTWYFADGPNAGQPVPGNITVINGVVQPLAGQSLTGSLYYPGTVITGGTTSDWPGWKNVGTADMPIWQPDGDGLRPSVVLGASVNPAATSAVVYPASAAACNPPGVPLLDKASPNEKTATATGVVDRGQKVSYSITLTNNGGQDVTSNLVDTLPAGVSNPTNFVPAAPTTIAGQVLTWANVTLTPGQKVTYSFDVTVALSAADGNLVNTATWASLSDLTTHVILPPEPVLTPTPTLDKTANPASGTAVAVGQVITYTVKTGNTGQAPATGDLIDTLPAGVELVGNFTKDGVSSAPTTSSPSQIVWKDVTVVPGQTITFTYQVKVLSAAVDLKSLVNTAQWLTLKDTTTHSVNPPAPVDIPKTGSSLNPITTLLWAAFLVGLGAMLVRFGRREETVQE